jgi:hypothetical protein
MRKITSILMICLSTTLLWFACNNNEITKIKPIVFGTETLKDSTGNCEEGNCFNAHMQILTAKPEQGAAAQAIADSIRIFTIKAMSDLMFDSVKTSTISQTLQQLRQEYDKQVAAQANIPKDEIFPVRYEIDMNVTMTHQNSKVVSISQGVYTYTGGAHPSTTNALHTFDILTGKTIELKDVVTDEKALIKIIESHLRKEREIPTNQTLRDAGFLYDDMLELPLPIDYAVTPNGIRFIYNAYDIAAYAMGPTDMEISFAELDKVLNLNKLR